MVHTFAASSPQCRRLYIYVYLYTYIVRNIKEKLMPDATDGYIPNGQSRSALLCKTAEAKKAHARDRDATPLHSVVKSVCLFSFRYDDNQTVMMMTMTNKTMMANGERE